MELDKLIEAVEHYAKNKSYHQIDKNDRDFIIRLHDQIIPMDIPLYKPNSGGCDACIRKAMSRFVININTLISYAGSKQPKAEDKPTPTQPKKKRGRPRKKK